MAHKFQYLNNWIQFKISDQKTADHAIWLFKLHYENNINIETEMFLKLISDYSNSFLKTGVV